MRISVYRRKCLTFVTITNQSMLCHYLRMGFVEEVGEMAGKFAKAIRAKGAILLTEDERLAIVKELGDISWFAVVSLKGKLNFEGKVRATDCKWRKDTTIIRENCFISARTIQYCIDALISTAYEATHASGGILSAQCAMILRNVAIIAGKLGYSLDEVFEINIAKLTDRKQRGVINGSGDNR